MLQVPSLDELTERLLIKKHGRRAAFGNSQALFTQPFKSIEKIAFQGQLAARMGIISLSYAQQALGLLLTNLKKDSPNLDLAVQNVRDIFAISTKSLDQMCRSGAFHQLIRRKATVADTGLHEFKDLQKSAGRGGSYSSRYNSRGSSSKTNSVGSFRFQGNKSNKA